jgi:hypothetical protein
MEFQHGKFVFIVFNNRLNQIEWLEDYSISNWEKDLPVIFDNHKFLLANFWDEVVVVFHSSQKAIVPTPFFDKIAPEKLIPNFECTDEVIEFKSYMLHMGRTLIYHVPAYFRNFLNSVYVNKEILFLPMEVCLPKVKNGLVVFVSNNNCYFSTYDDIELKDSKFIKIKDNRHFELCVDYFLEAGTQVVLLGTITTYSPLFNSIKNRDYEVVFGELASEVKFTQYLSEVPKHKYFTIFNSITCF